MTERRDAIERALQDDASRSDRSVASACGVTSRYVNRIRREMERTGRLRSPGKRQGADDRWRAVEVRGPDPTYDGGLVAKVREIFR